MSTQMYRIHVGISMPSERGRMSDGRGWVYFQTRNDRLNEYLDTLAICILSTPVVLLEYLESCC